MSSAKIARIVGNHALELGLPGGIGRQDPAVGDLSQAAGHCVHDFRPIDHVVDRFPRSPIGQRRGSLIIGPHLHFDKA